MTRRKNEQDQNTEDLIDLACAHLLTNTESCEKHVHKWKPRLLEPDGDPPNLMETWASLVAKAIGDANTYIAHTWPSNRLVTTSAGAPWVFWWPRHRFRTHVRTILRSTGGTHLLKLDKNVDVSPLRRAGRVYMDVMSRDHILLVIGIQGPRLLEVQEVAWTELIECANTMGGDTDPLSRHISRRDPTQNLSRVALHTANSAPPEHEEDSWGTTEVETEPWLPIEDPDLPECEYPVARSTIFSQE